MKKPLHFEERRSGATDAMFGVIAVARIEPTGEKPFAARFYFRLPDLPERCFFATDEAAARVAVGRHIDRWLAAAGLRAD